MNPLTTALRAKTEALQQQLMAKVEANLSGDILQERSGTLKRSIVADLETTDDVFASSISSTGVPYAALQEYGGRTSPHDIVPLKAAALAFAGGGKSAFARRVRHPGSAMPARAYLGGALQAMRAQIESDLKNTVRAALDAVDERVSK